MLMFIREGYEKTKSLWGMTAINNSKVENRCTIYRERPVFFPSSRVTDGFHQFLHWNTRVEPSPFLHCKLSWQKWQVTDSLIFSFVLQSFTGCDSVAMELLPCFGVFAFQICKRFFYLNFWSACTVLMKKLTARIRRLASHWTLSAIAPGRRKIKSPYHSPLSFEPNPS